MMDHVNVGKDGEDLTAQIRNVRLDVKIVENVHRMDHVNVLLVGMEKTAPLMDVQISVPEKANVGWIVVLPNGHVVVKLDLLVLTVPFPLKCIVMMDLITTLMVLSIVMIRNVAHRHLALLNLYVLPQHLPSKF